MNERFAIGGSRSAPREDGAIGFAASAWRQHPERRTHELHQRLLRLWAEAEVARLAGERFRQQLAAGEPGPEGSAVKLTYARLNQEISGLEIELAGPDGLTYDDWTMRRTGPDGQAASSDLARGPAFRYLRSKGNSIEGGTSEILRNIIAERVLGLPAEPRTDTAVPWKDLPR
jgi:alkylation response protein AidB-like acyl-CoA dehydrogenase